MKSTITDVSFRHPLIGTWTLGDSTNVEYTISALTAGRTALAIGNAPPATFVGILGVAVVGF